MTLKVETAINVRGDEVHFFTPRPSDTNPQNYHLRAKYLTRDCPTCFSFIPPERSGEIIQMGVENNKDWTPPEESTVQGVCNWGKCLKILVQRPKGSMYCTLRSEKRQKQHLLYK